MLAQRTNKYLETTVQTASPSQLLIMLIDGAIRFCRQGIDSIQKNDMQEANRALCRVQDIISEFKASLDRNSPLSENLLMLYDYFSTRLIEANVKKDVEPAQEVLGYLLELKETWIQASLSLRVGVKNG